MEKWATEIAIKVIKQGTTVESIAQALRDERSRAVKWCDMAPIQGTALDAIRSSKVTPRALDLWQAGLTDSRRYIKAAIKGE